jgi:hypothetical protein
MFGRFLAIEPGYGARKAKTTGLGRTRSDQVPCGPPNGEGSGAVDAEPLILEASAGL